MRALALSLVLVLIATLAPSTARAESAPRAVCMDGWAGELCFDVLTFRATATEFTVGGHWYGAGYPVGYRDHHGRGPMIGLQVFDVLKTARFFDPDTRSGTITTDSRVFSHETVAGYDEFGDRIYEQHYLIADGWEDVAGFTFLARARATPDGSGSLWEQVDCFMPGWTHLTDFRGDSQPCRVVSVPEPGSALLLATGLLGLAAMRRREH